MIPNPRRKQMIPVVQLSSTPFRAPLGRLHLEAFLIREIVTEGLRSRMVPTRSKRTPACSAVLPRVYVSKKQKTIVHRKYGSLFLSYWVG